MENAVNVQTQKDKYYQVKMSTEDFNRLSTYIYNELGIKMPVEKKLMLQSRLLKRLSELKIDNFKQYLDYVFSKEGKVQELVMLTDLVTTNKTDFFREPAHFEYLNETVLPQLTSINRRRKIKIWSAGCSSGEEPYTLAITLNEFLQDMPGFDFHITATDLAMRMLKKAAMAIYPIDRVANIPLSIKRKYFLKSKDQKTPTVRVVQELRKKITFQQMNFMNHSYPLDDDYDIIFCRNVIIYFDRTTQESVIGKQLRHLKSGGYYFLGHSESITSMDLPLNTIRPTISQKI
ncbi:MAG TPA: protein-glutamate O-methyltransferase [Bacteroidales bacterium]|nr:protein-glutamate O-methyltransferase [Bacteroidales bacterium]